MSMGGGGASNSEVVKLQKEQARKQEIDEMARARRIAKGSGTIDAIFDGGGAPRNLVPLPKPGWKRKFTESGKRFPSFYDPNKTYYTADGEVFEFDPFERGFKGARTEHGHDGWVQTQKAFAPFVNRARRGDLYAAPPKEYEGIGDAFYEGYRDAFIEPYLGADYAAGFTEDAGGELNDQFRRARRQNAFSLARGGLQDSSAAAIMAGDLADDYAAQRQSILTKADEAMAGLRDSTNQAKNRAYELLYMTEDPTRAANAALNEVNAVQMRSPKINPLGDVFDAIGRGIESYNRTRTNRAVASALAAPSPFANRGRNI